MGMRQRIDGNGNLQVNGDLNVNNITDYRPSVKHFYPQEIKNIIECFSNCFERYEPENEIDDNIDYEFDYTEKEVKNRLNSLSDEYFEYIISEHLMYFYKIDLYLKDPKNVKLLNKYKRIAKIIRFRIATIRSAYSSFDEILGVIYEEIMESQSLLKGMEDLCIIFINYMYWNCDIGKKARRS